MDLSMSEHQEDKEHPPDPYALGMQMGGQRMLQRYIGHCNIQVAAMQNKHVICQHC